MKLTYPEWVHYETKSRLPSKGWSNYQHGYHHTCQPNFKNNGNLSTYLMRMTMSTGSTMSSRIQRKVPRIPSKRQPGKTLPGKLHSMARTSPAKVNPGKRIMQGRIVPAHYDNSSDSGLGFEHHMESIRENARQLNLTPRPNETFQKFTNPIELDDSRLNLAVNESKRSRTMGEKFDIEDACSNYAFEFNRAFTARIPKALTASMIRNPVVKSTRRPQTAAQSQFGAVTSRDGKVQLQILAQPETQHRARYQTEGSRGAIKDRSGNGFPIVKLTGYNKPTLLHIFIGTDVGRVAPHMFYQACRVAGKNSTPCDEKTSDQGTVIIKIELKPDNDMTATCDCVGILKQRNVDVEQRFPKDSPSSPPRSKKKSTKCRMVFRANLTHDDGSIETLQICSQPIICTQPPGVPEICKKSLSTCEAAGGENLFIIGKNFLKDTKVVFQARRPSTHRDGYEVIWEKTCVPDKEFLHQSHLICTIPEYANPNITEAVTVQLFVISSDKKSESHSFVYTPNKAQSILMSAASMGAIQNNSLSNNQDLSYSDDTSNHSNPSCPLMVWTPTMEPINEIDSGMMPPPLTLPLSVRRPSSGTMLGEQISPPLMKTEINDESSQSSLPDTMNHDALDRMTINENSMDASSMNDLYLKRRIRKRSIDILDNNSIMNSPVEMLNNLSGFISNDGQMNIMQSSDMTIVNLRIKQEKMAAQIRQFELVTKADQSMNRSVNTFYTIDSNSINPQDGAVSMPLFSNNANSSSDVLLQENEINNQINPSANTIINQSSFGLMTDENAANSMTHLLNYPQNSNNESLMATPNSNHSHDVILNSQPAASINSPNGLMLTSPGSVNTENSMSSDVILNMDVSPSMMCQSSTDAIPTQVTSVLSCLPMQQQSPQDTYSNLMQTDTILIPRTSPVAVKEMLLNAAADILSSQPSELTAENALNAIMSLNANPMMTDCQPHVSQMMITQSAGSSNSMMLHSNNQPNMNEAMCTQTTLGQDIFNNESIIMASSQMLANSNMSANTENIMDSISIANMVATQDLMNQEIQNDRIARAQQNFLNDLQTHGLSNETQNSLLEADLMQQNKKNKEKNIENQLQMQNPPIMTNIPQELTNMSDNDLIRFINPICFEKFKPPNEK